MPSLRAGRSRMARLETLQALRASLAAHGEMAAVVAFADGNEAPWSFARVADLSARLGEGLVRAGIGRGASVGLIAPNGAAWITAFWGIVAAAAVAVPMDPQTTDSELA